MLGLMMGLAKDARLLGLDWGTSTLRAFLFGTAGKVLAENFAPSGVMHLERFIPAGASDVPREKLFEAALNDVCRVWPVGIVSRLPVIACGMVGSTVGWKEAAYLKAPAGISELAKSLTNLQRTKGGSVQIVPGVCSRGKEGLRLPEIMRGEETQIAGILSVEDEAHSMQSGDMLIGLPGTHSKWVHVCDKRFVSFSTFVTGELYALLTTQSVVAKTRKKRERFEAEAFESGLRLGQARNAEAAGGLLSTIFSVRSRQVLGELKEEEQPDYLSGLLIGNELTGVERALAHEKRKLRDFAAILLAGDPALCARYQSACQYLQWPMVGTVENATAKGLWSVARQAGMVD